jgi:hypothetical protein
MPVPPRTPGNYRVYRREQKDRQLRYQHASEIRNDLQQLRADTQATTTISAGPKSIATPILETAVSRRNRWKLALPLGLGLALLGAIFFGLSHRRTSQASQAQRKGRGCARRLRELHGRPVFDNALKQALSLSLRQSPFLNILSDSKVAATPTILPKSHDLTCAERVTMAEQELAAFFGAVTALFGATSGTGLGRRVVARVASSQCSARFPA